MTEKMINGTAPASGAYVPPPMRPAVSSPDSGSGAVADKSKNKGKSTGAYVPPQKAKATKCPAPAPSTPKKTAGVWGPSQTPQVPAAPLKGIDKRPTAIYKGIAGAWGPSKAPQVPAPPLKSPVEGSGSFSKGTALSGTEPSAPEKTAGDLGPSEEPQVPAAPMDDGCQAGHGLGLSSGSIAAIWNSAAGSQKPEVIRTDGSGSITRKSIYSLNLAPRHIPGTCPWMSADWGYAEELFFDPRAERHAAAAPGSFHCAAGHTTTVAQPSPGASPHTTFSSQTASSVPSESCPMSTASRSSSRRSSSLATPSTHTSSPHSSYWPAAAYLSEEARQCWIEALWAGLVDKTKWTGQKSDLVYTKEEIEAIGRL